MVVAVVAVVVVLLRRPGHLPVMNLLS